MISEKKKKYTNWEPVYAKQIYMHSLWIIYFCINVQIIGEQKRR